MFTFPELVEKVEVQLAEHCEKPLGSRALYGKGWKKSVLFKVNENRELLDVEINSIECEFKPVNMQVEITAKRLQMYQHKNADDSKMVIEEILSERYVSKHQLKECVGFNREQCMDTLPVSELLNEQVTRKLVVIKSGKIEPMKPENCAVRLYSDGYIMLCWDTLGNVKVKCETNGEVISGGFQKMFGVLEVEVLQHAVNREN